AAAVRTADTSRHRLAAVCRGVLALARPGAVRAGPALGRLALRAARLFPRHGLAVLVSGGPSLSEPAALVALAAVSLPDRGRRAEHHPVRAAHVLQSSAVSSLRAGAAAGRAVRPGRPVSGRRPQVGSQLTGLPPAVVRSRHPPDVRRAASGEWTFTADSADLRAHRPPPPLRESAASRSFRPAPRAATGTIPEMAPRTPLSATALAAASGRGSP